MDAQSPLDRPKSNRQYTDEEWERVKEPFRHYYLEKGLPLREAAARIKAECGFDATPRQWERRIGADKWNFSKYANREERLKVIEASGKSLHDISHRGRRKSTGSPDDRLLGDRNMRRWARRELSRDASRRRSKSVSGTSEADDQEMSSMAPSPAPSEFSMGDFSQPQFNEMWMSSAQSSQNTPPNIPQIHIDHFQDPLSVPPIPFSQPQEHASYITNDVEQGNSLSSNALGDSMLTITSDFVSYDNPADAFAHSQNLDGSVSPQQAFAWTSAHSFPAHPHQESFPSFNQETNTSFMDMLEIRPADEILNAGRFESAPVSHQEQLPTPVVPADVVPDLDNTHADVHSLLQEHYRGTLQMIKECMHSCKRSGVNEDGMKRLRLLEVGMRMQNDETDRNIRNTLKNIASTQRQATRNIFELSKARKRKIDELKVQIDVLSNQQNSFAFG